MAFLYNHLEVPTWAYFSPHPKVTENTYQLNSERMLYVGEAGVNAAYKIGPIPAGTLVVCDMEEVNSEQGYRRVFKFKDLPEYVPAFVTAFLKEKYPGVNEEWQLWLDWSGLSDWTSPEPDPIEPEPDPELPAVVWEGNLFGYHIVITAQKLL